MVKYGHNKGVANRAKCGEKRLQHGTKVQGVFYKAARLMRERLKSFACIF